MRTLIDRSEVAWTDSAGDGEPLLLMHGGGLAGWMEPLTAHLSGFRVITMVRAGHLGAPADGLTVADHARHASVLLRQLDAAPAHVVAHSAGSAVALQLAADDPAAVRSLTLAEPPLVDPLADPADRDALHAAFGAAMSPLGRGDFAAAFDAFMTLVCGPGCREVIDAALGAGVTDEAARTSRNFFAGEVAALNAWTFDPAAVTRPVLLVQGGDSPAVTHRLIAHLAGRLPVASVATIDGVNHLMPLTAPAELGRLVAEFCQSPAMSR
jgi:pimeloyl-ACP methyl ester carboxylesterase